MPDTILVVTAPVAEHARRDRHVGAGDDGHIQADERQSMAEAVDVISSVSGGSVAAGYSPCTAREGLPVTRKDFRASGRARAIC